MVAPIWRCSDIRLVKPVNSVFIPKQCKTRQVAELLLVLVLGLVGPMLASTRRFALPVAVGEILAGVVFGASGFHLIDAAKPNLQLLAQVGFALVMMVVGSHIDVRRVFGTNNTVTALVNVLMVAVAATMLGLLVGNLTGQSGNAGIFAVLMTSSSAAVVLPLVAQPVTAKPAKKKTGANKNLKATAGPAILIAQVAMADLLSIVSLPLVSHAADQISVVVGLVVLAVAALFIYALLRLTQARGWWKRFRQFSADRRFGLELRLSLILLLGLIWLAQSFQVTIMLAGFALGLAIAANGMPRRLAKQLFAVSEGLFSPVFFVLLGASIDVTAVFGSPELLALAGLLGLGAILTHLVPMATGMRFDRAIVAAAQLGVPAAAVSIGLANGSLNSGQGAAIMLGALMTLAATAVTVAAKKSTLS